MKMLKPAEDVLAVVRQHLIENGLDLPKLENYYVEPKWSDYYNWRAAFETKSENPCYFEIYHFKDKDGVDEAFMFLSVTMITLGRIAINVSRLNSILQRSWAHIHPVKFTVEERGYLQLLIRAPVTAFSLEYVKNSLIWALLRAAEELEQEYCQPPKKRASGIH